jgi:pimeloyl-ACP methyl ester carboxylesterase
MLRARWTRWLIGFVGAVVVTTGAALLWRSIAIAQVDAERAITSEDGIDSLERVPINGVEQWVSIRGQDRAKPVLLFLHGGPGFPMLPFAHSFQTPWEKDFVVVQWDQRGTGKTFREADPQAILQSMHIEQFVDDGRVLAEYLQRRLGKRKLVLLGHSWGSMIGIRLVHAHPEFFSAYVGTGQVIDVMENERVGYLRALAVARERNNTDALGELEAIAPYPDASRGTSEPRKVLRRWQREFGMATRGKSDLQMFLAMLNAGLRSPDYSLADHWSWISLSSSEYSRNALAREIDAFSASALTPQFAVPMFFFLGRHDWQVPSVIAKDFLGKVEAPSRTLVWFEDSAHSPPSEQAAAFHAALVKYVAPVAQLEN